MTIAVTVIIFPCFVSVSFAVSFNTKKFGFLVKLYGICVYKKSKEFDSFALFKSFGDNKMLKKIPKISLLSINGEARTGINDDFFLTVTAVSFFNCVKNIVFRIIHEKKPFLRLKYDINLFSYEKKSDSVLQIKAIFNLVDAIIYFFQILSEKLYDYFGQKRQD